MAAPLGIYISDSLDDLQTRLTAVRATINAHLVGGSSWGRSGISMVRADLPTCLRLEAELKFAIDYKTGASVTTTYANHE